MNFITGWLDIWTQHESLYLWLYIVIDICCALESWDFYLKMTTFSILNFDAYFLLLLRCIILHGLNTNLGIIIFLVSIVFVHFRFLTQPNDKTSPEKSPEGSPKLRYGATRHKTQPITPEEKREAEGGQSSEVKVSVKDRYIVYQYQ